MNSALRTFFLFTTFLVNSSPLFGMHTGKKPSLTMPTGTWEDQDAIDRLKNAEEWTAKATIASNVGIVVSKVKTNNIPTMPETASKQSLHDNKNAVPNAPQENSQDISSTRQ